MGIHCVLPVKQEYKTGAPLVDKSLEILGVWHWRRWQSHLNCPASMTSWDAQRFSPTTANLSMRLSVTLDHTIAHMLDLSVLLLEISLF